MKFSLRRRAAAPKAKAPEGMASAREDKGVVTLGTLISRAFLAAAVIVIAAAVAVHSLAVMRADVSHRQQVEVSANSLAKQVAFRLQRYAEVMDVLVRDGALRQAFRGGNPEAVSAKEAELSSLFPSALKLRLLPPGVEEVDSSSTPHLSYACLAMLREAETSDKPVAAEVHLLGTPQQHIALARRVASADGRYVIVSLSNGTIGPTEPQLSLILEQELKFPLNREELRAQLNRRASDILGCKVSISHETAAIPSLVFLESLGPVTQVDTVTIGNMTPILADTSAVKRPGDVVYQIYKNDDNQ